MPYLPNIINCWLAKEHATRYAVESFAQTAARLVEIALDEPSNQPRWYPQWCCCWYAQRHTAQKHWCTYNMDPQIVGDAERYPERQQGEACNPDKNNLELGRKGVPNTAKPAISGLRPATNCLHDCTAIVLRCDCTPASDRYSRFALTRIVGKGQVKSPSFW